MFWTKTAVQGTEGVDASGLTIIVTGGTHGLGKANVQALAKRGARVFIAARNMSAAEQVKEEIVKKQPDARIDLLKIDLASLESVRTAAEEFLALGVALNVLVNNAGMINYPPYRLSPDGIELTFATNYLGHFLFTQLLLGKLKETAKESGIVGRIVNVSSQGHEQFVYNEGIRFDKIKNPVEGLVDMFKAYGQSKLAQILYTKELSKHLQEEGANVTVNALHPGVVNSNITANVNLWLRPLTRLLLWLFFASPEEGVATQMYLAIGPGAAGVTGKYFHSDGKETKLTQKHALDEELQKKLWEGDLKFGRAQRFLYLGGHIYVT